MARHNRKVDEERVQEVLLDDPGFLREIIQQILQEMLEAQRPNTQARLTTSVEPPAPATATTTSRERCAPGSAPSTCSSLRIRKEPSPPG